MVRLTTYLDLESLLRFKDPVQLQVKSYISDQQFQQIVTFQQAMFPALMPWPMTLTYILTYIATYQRSNVQYLRIYIPTYLCTNYLHTFFGIIYVLMYYLLTYVLTCLRTYCTINCFIDCLIIHIEVQQQFTYVPTNLHTYIPTMSLVRLPFRVRTGVPSESSQKFLDLQKMEQQEISGKNKISLYQRLCMILEANPQRKLLRNKSKGLIPPRT